MSKPVPILLQEYLYVLPEKKIASYPLPDRSDSKLLLYKAGSIGHDSFSSLPGHLPGSSWLLFNNTRVIQARMKFKKPSGASIEIFCLEPVLPASYEQIFHSTGPVQWDCMVGNVKKWKSGPVFLETRVGDFPLVLKAELLERKKSSFLISFEWDRPEVSFGEIIEVAGSTPIPPYLGRKAEESDKDRYQTVYSRNKGSVAAPTAGLHFTQQILSDIDKRGFPGANLTLHVGAGTFVPVKEENARRHSMHSEQVVVDRSFLDFVSLHPEGAIAVGTTSTRSMESLYWLGVKLMQEADADPAELALHQWENEALPQDVPLLTSLETLMEYCDHMKLSQLIFSTQLMIVPGYRFRVISGLITNFHMPGSTLLMLIAAFIGDDWRKVYDYALRKDFRFLSYGDSSLLLP